MSQVSQAQDDADDYAEDEFEEQQLDDDEPKPLVDSNNKAKKK